MKNKKELLTVEQQYEAYKRWCRGDKINSMAKDYYVGAKYLSKCIHKVRLQEQQELARSI